MKVKYDLHIHSALSPCAEDEMTPNNILNMAEVNGLHVIAVTDHNSVGNIRALAQCAEDKSIVVVPGIEVESAEEVHICCLFPNVEAAEEMGDFVREHLMPVKNKRDVLGRQQLFDSSDRFLGEEEQMLLFSSTLTSEEIFQMAEKLGGCAFFAHVDRTSYSVLSVLGGFPQETDRRVVEVSDSQTGRDFALHKDELGEKLLLFSSDSHRLADINRGTNEIEVKTDNNELTASDIIDWIREKNMR